MRHLLVLIFFLSVHIAGITQVPTLEWVNTYGSNMGDYSTSVAIDDLGNVFTAGTFSETIDFDPGPGVYNLTSHGHYDIFITKVDAAGNFLWAISFGDTRTDQPEAVTVDNNGNLTVVGVYSGTVDFDPGPGVYNMVVDPQYEETFVLKLDGNGNFLWAKSFVGTNMMGIDHDENGNLYATGGFYSITDFDPGPGTQLLTETSYSGLSTGIQDVFVLKLDAMGNFVWVKQMGGVEFDQAWDIAIDPFGNVLSTGHFRGTADFDPSAAVYNLTAGGLFNSFILKLNANGDFVWAKKIHSTGENYSRGVDTDNLGNVYMGGTMYAVSDLNPGPGTFNADPVTGKGHMYLVKLDAAGNFVWGRQFGNHPDDLLRAVTVDLAGNVYATGHFKGSADFDPGNGTYNLVSNGYEDIFILKLDKNGNLVWAAAMGSINNLDTGIDIKTDLLNNVYTVGMFTETTDFDPSAGVHNVMVVDNGDAFVQKLNQCGNTTFFTLNTAACFTYSLNNQAYSKSGVYRQVLQNSMGCDSIITLNLTISGSNDTLQITACDNYSWNNRNYSATGFYRDTLTSFYGCDSIVNLNLTIKRRIFSTIDTAICEGEVLSGYTTTGKYIDTYIASNGCDSIRTLNLTVRPRSYAEINVSICEGEKYLGYSATGTYFDTLISFTGCDSIRTIHLLVHPTAVTQNAASICKGQSYLAGGKLQTITGVYKDTLKTVFSCDSIVVTNLTVHENPVVNLGTDRGICAGQSISFDPGSFSNYVWQDQSTRQVFSATSIGTYWVKVTDNNNCIGSDTIIINQVLSSPANFLKQIDSLCEHDRLTIQPLNDYPQYNWSTGSIQETISVESPGNYWLSVTDNNGCTGGDTIQVLAKQECRTVVYVPTAFTPNKDGKNDVFRAIVSGQLLSFKFQVFARSGQLIFQTTNPADGWNGYINGTLQPSTTFVWQCTYQFVNGQPEMQKGTVTLVK